VFFIENFIIVIRLFLASAHKTQKTTPFLFQKFILFFSLKYFKSLENGVD